MHPDWPAARILRTMLLIRRLEERVDALFAAGELRGTSHLSAGQEATAVGACAALRADDYVTSNHRGHGHFLAKGGEARRIMAELFGKATGYSQGKGGTQHMADFSIGFLGMNGITGGMLPIAAGAAFSARYRGSGQVALAFFGDGASNQGTFHEALNLAAIWRLPAVFLCENNCYAMSSPACHMVSGARIADRAAGYGLPGVTVDGNDVAAVYAAVAEAAARARAGDGPTLIEALTYRILGHSRGDLRVYRTREEEAEWAARDPIARFTAAAQAADILSPDDIAASEAAVATEVAAAEAFARASPFLAS
ncbi:MAG TPA: thiamine pyrophosphate-dependent dehydrogenase E1 component subunit alpha [Armatimonadota bacterium]|nr:thiamine pyrophosphate-dependent dehydrogenase E1 component subunit alpha [Armatimonadota bacterium]HOS42682.1 thiamine pyrophosphate-dependent dehydrogenase E1 component subunit alpha [Armatimonadota bacterium]